MERRLGNFFQSAVLKTDTGRTLSIPRTNRYVDTAGFSGDSVETTGSGQNLATINLIEPGGSATYDAVSSNNEGVFREISVSRTLLKTISTLSATYPFGAAIPFSEIWTVFSSTSANMFANTNMKFRNSGNFLQSLDTIVQASYPGSAAAWAALIADERQSIQPVEYNNPLVAQAPACGSTRTISPVVDEAVGWVWLSIFIDTSNTLRSSDFFQFYHDGSAQSIRLNYTQTNVMDPRVDLDLIVYSNGYDYYDDDWENIYGVTNSTIATRSRRVSDSDVEYVNLAGLAAGYYQIQVKTNTYNKLSASLIGSASYTLKLIKNSDLTERNLCATY